MLHDDIILDLTPEVDIAIDERLTEDIILEPYVDGSIVVNQYSDIVVIIDLESMTGEEENPFNRYGKVQRVITFFKSVLGKKETFARVSFDIRNNIQTIGTAIINSTNHNLVQRVFTFGSTIAGKKTTFGQSSFVISNNIQTVGINTIGGINFYGSGLYGAGIYPGSLGYGSGVYGMGIYPGEALSLKINFGSVISGNIPYKQTSIGEVSLASHATPALDTDHSIEIRARTLSGSSGVIRAALYEGTINRSGNLETPILTNSLADYSLSIPESVAATITDYSNLSIKFWGYDLAGKPLVFEIARIYLKLPIPTGGISYGIISRPFTFGKSVSGTVSSKATPTAQISLSSHGIPSARTNHTIKIRARTLSGSTGVLKVALYEGAINRSGDLITPPLTNTLSDYTLVILDSLANTIIDYSNLSIKIWGFDIAGNALVFEVARLYLELPVSTGNTTQYGAVSRTITFTKAVSGVAVNKKTSVAEISLASHGIPAARTNHSIKIRARTTSGSTGVIKAALYEGATLRSGSTPLASSPLTNSLSDYTLPIPEAEAVGITSYANLSIRFWGHDSSAGSLVFEIAKIELELPISAGATTHYGVVSRVTTFNRAVAGIISSKRTAAAEISLASHGTPSARTNHTIKVRARTVSGSTGVLKAELYEGSTLRSGGTLTTSALTNSLTDYSLAIPDAAAATITSYANLSIKVWGFDSAGNALVFEVARLYLELPTP